MLNGVLNNLSVSKLVDGYFEAEQIKRTYNEKLMEYAERFINVNDWKIINFERICPLIECPEGYISESDLIIKDISKDQEIYFVIKAEDGTIKERVKVIVNVSGMEQIYYNELRELIANFTLDSDEEKHFFFCGTMRFKVVFSGQGMQTLRYEFRKNITKDEMKKIMSEKFAAKV